MDINVIRFPLILPITLTTHTGGQIILHIVQKTHTHTHTQNKLLDTTKVLTTWSP